MISILLLGIFTWLKEVVLGYKHKIPHPFTLYLIKWNDFQLVLVVINNIQIHLRSKAFNQKKMLLVKLLIGNINS